MDTSADEYVRAKLESAWADREWTPDLPTATAMIVKPYTSTAARVMSIRIWSAHWPVGAVERGILLAPMIALAESDGLPSMAVVRCVPSNVASEPVLRWSHLRSRVEEVLRGIDSTSSTDHVVWLAEKTSSPVKRFRALREWAMSNGHDWRVVDALFNATSINGEVSQAPKLNPPRRTKGRGVPSPPTLSTREIIYARDGHRCAYCGVRDGLTLDHIMPMSRGGPKRARWNLVSACSPCNHRKADFILPESLNGVMHLRFLSDEARELLSAHHPPEWFALETER